MCQKWSCRQCRGTGSLPLQLRCYFVIKYLNSTAMYGILSKSHWHTKRQPTSKTARNNILVGRFNLVYLPLPAVALRFRTVPRRTIYKLCDLYYFCIAAIGQHKRRPFQIAVQQPTGPCFILRVFVKKMRKKCISILYKNRWRCANQNVKHFFLPSRWSVNIPICRGKLCELITAKLSINKCVATWRSISFARCLQKMI